MINTRAPDGANKTLSYRVLSPHRPCQELKYLNNQDIDLGLVFHGQRRGELPGRHLVRFRLLLAQGEEQPLFSVVSFLEQNNAISP